MENTALIGSQKQKSSMGQTILNVFLVVGVIASVVLSVLVATGKISKSDSNTTNNNNNSTTVNNYYNNNNAYFLAGASYSVANVTSGNYYPGIGFFAINTVVGSDGKPVIVFTYQSYSLSFLKCSDPACLGPTIQTNIATARSSTFISAKLGRDGMVVVAYFDLPQSTSSNGTLNVAHCENLNCTNVTVTQVDGDRTGWYPTIHIAADGNPLITYLDNGSKNPKIAHCVDPACSKPAKIGTFIFDGGLEGITSAIGLDGNLLLVVMSQNNSYAALHCLDTLCTGVEPFGYFGSSDIFAAQTYIGFSGNVHIVIPNYVLTCDSLQCANPTSAAVPMGNTTRFAVATDITSVPVIASINGTNMDYIACMDEDCTANTYRPNVYPVSQTIFDADVTMGSSGWPVITSVSGTLTAGGNEDVLVQACASHICTAWKN